MTQNHFSRSLSEKLISHRIKWESQQRWFRHHDNGEQKEIVADNCTDWTCSCSCDCTNNYPEELEPSLTLEIALSKDFLSQLTTAVLSASTDIAWNFTAGGYEGAEREIIKLINEK
jgi:hypothetical protein